MICVGTRGRGGGLDIRDISTRPLYDGYCCCLEFSFQGQQRTSCKGMYSSVGEDLSYWQDLHGCKIHIVVVCRWQPHFLQLMGCSLYMPDCILLHISSIQHSDAG